MATAFETAQSFSLLTLKKEKVKYFFAVDFFNLDGYKANTIWNTYKNRSEQANMNLTMSQITLPYRDIVLINNKILFETGF